MKSSINILLENTTATYAKMLSRFRPCKPGKEFLEQNLITLLAHEFLKINPNGLAFSEIPFITPNGKGHWGSRLDGYLATDTHAYLVEAKGSQPRDTLFQLIEEDLSRITSPELKESFITMATEKDRSYVIPENVSGLIIADCGCVSAAESWNQNSQLENQFPMLSKITTSSYKIGKYERYSYYILVGVIENVW